MLPKNKKTTILITGASGFIGKYLLNYLKNEYEIIAMARRSGTQAGVPFHPNIRWIQWDIANKLNYSDVMGYLIGRGGADIVIHLAGYYDYEYDNNPEYERTNIKGTLNMLQLSRHIDVKHFLFASSLAACKFPENGKQINEQYPVDASFGYAKSKKVCEDYCKEYSKFFKCSIIRFAAVFSDWCEYGPFYQFLSSWLSGKWDSRILGGKGNSAITYIHLHDLASLIYKIIIKTDELSNLNTFIASPEKATSHKELFKIATHDYYGVQHNPIFIPKIFTYPGIAVKKVLGKVKLTSKPFEKFWMLQYLDKKLEVDNLATQNILDWNTTPRFHIIRRLIYLLDKMKSHPNEWYTLNEAATKRKTHQPNLLIYEILIASENQIEESIFNIVHKEKNREIFLQTRQLSKRNYKITFSTLYHLLLAAVRSADRSLVPPYIRSIAIRYYNTGIGKDELINLIETISEVVTKDLREKNKFTSKKQDIYDYVGMTLQLAIDEVENTFDNITRSLVYEPMDKKKGLTERDTEKEVKQLSAFFQDHF